MFNEDLPLPKSANKMASIEYGQQKMIPYMKEGRGTNLDWFKDKGLSYIVKFFIKMEKNLVVEQSNVGHLTGKLCNTVHLGNLVGVKGCNWKKYKFSGQCIIAILVTCGSRICIWITFQSIIIEGQKK